MGRDAAPRPFPERAAAIDAAIASLGDCGVEQLHLQWRNHLGGAAATHLPRWLLLRLLAHRLQVAALGDLDKATLRNLRLQKRGGEGGEASERRPFETRGPTTREGVGLRPGSLLVREWNGRPERVMVLEEGFAWNGATYRSLSQIAKAMTGTSWNGHRFFGLRQAKGQGVASNGNRDPKKNLSGPAGLDRDRSAVEGAP
jgi:Protein of unknown function (DUF2924)